MSCKELSRRDFLQRGGCGVFTLAALGLGVDVALPVEAIAGSGGGSERSYPIPPGDSVNIDRSVQVILVRYSNRVYAFSLVCPHEKAAVKWLNKDNRFQCTKHDSKYTPNGIFMSGHATRNLDRFPIRRDGGNVVVDLTKVYRSDAHAQAWAAAGVDV